jgi:two-component system sensor histidine kinase/response regulator
MKTSSAQFRFESLCILVVDDHAINREFLCSGLKPHCARVDSTSSGREAIERCARFEYDLILMDLHMPGLDGLAAALAIRQLDAAGSDAPIVFLTADIREEERQRLHTAGFHHILTKPVSLEVLFRSVQNGLDSDGRESTTPAAQPPGSPLLDPESALGACNGRSDLLRTMQMKLATDLNERLPVLDDQIRNGEFSAAADLLHQWIGALGYVGARALTRRGHDLERALLDDDPDFQAGAFVDFMRCAQATAQALEHSEVEGVE